MKKKYKKNKKYIGMNFQMQLWIVTSQYVTSQ